MANILLNTAELSMADPMVKQEMKRHAVIMVIKAELSNLKIAQFLKVARSFVYKIRKELEAKDENVSSASNRKKHRRRTDTFRTPKFIQQVKQTIDENSRRSMRLIAKEHHMSEGTIRNVVHKDIRYKSYAMRKGHFISETVKENHLIRSKRHPNKLKNPAEKDVISFFSDEKNFDQDQKVNRRNDRWLCADPSEVPRVMRTKFPATNPGDAD
ncbi:uncharacterized protein LOC128247010 [Octopus bimaculoides]|uniref:uncharacterized protein LOC128247010 n=1 Tax=Octopus bimaculoides TaxID=37653 RepID=UPI0022E643F7|nr:uncharacterized protein LOC128247010 [Octopus bimaculoides]